MFGKSKTYKTGYSDNNNQRRRSRDQHDSSQLIGGPPARTPRLLHLTTATTRTLRWLHRSGDIDASLVPLGNAQHAPSPSPPRLQSLPPPPSPPLPLLLLLSSASDAPGLVKPPLGIVAPRARGKRKLVILVRHLLRAHTAVARPLARRRQHLCEVTRGRGCSLVVDDSSR